MQSYHRIINVFPTECIENIYQINKKTNKSEVIETNRIDSSYLTSVYSNEKEFLQQSIIRLKNQIRIVTIPSLDQNARKGYSNPNHVELGGGEKWEELTMPVQYSQIYPQKEGQDYNAYIYCLMENWLPTRVEFMELNDLRQSYERLQKEQETTERERFQKEQQRLRKLETPFEPEMKIQYCLAKDRWDNLLRTLTKDLIAKTIEKWESTKERNCPNCRSMDPETMLPNSFSNCMYINKNEFFDLRWMLSYLEGFFGRMNPNETRKYISFIKSLKNLNESLDEESMYQQINEYIKIRKLSKDIGTQSHIFKETPVDYINKNNIHVILDHNYEYCGFKIKTFNCCACNLINFNVQCYLMCGKERGKEPVKLLESKGISFESDQREKEFITKMRNELKKNGYRPHDLMSNKTNIGGKKYPCKDGHIVDSHLEVRVDNLLRRENIPHRVPQHFHSLDIPFYTEGRGRNLISGSIVHRRGGSGQRLRPDFVLKDCYIEIAGLSGWNLSKYDKKMELKLEMSKKKGINLVILKSSGKDLKLEGNYQPDYLSRFFS